MRNRFELLAILIPFLFCVAALGMLASQGKALLDRVEHLEQIVRQQDEQQLSERLRMLETRSQP